MRVTICTAPGFRLRRFPICSVMRIRIAFIELIALGPVSLRFRLALGNQQGQQLTLDAPPALVLVRKRRMPTGEDIKDGSSFAVHPALADVFPGRHTTISPAAVELHATMSLWSDQAVVLTIALDSEGERQFLPRPEELRLQGDLA